MIALATARFAPLPADSELRRTNVIAALTGDHATARSIAPAPLGA